MPEVKLTDWQIKNLAIPLVDRFAEIEEFYKNPENEQRFRKHRFSIKRSLDDYEETTLNRCIRMGVQFKYKTMACDKLIAEMQIVYKDENGKLHCLCEDLHDFTFSIKHKGDMQIDL